MLNNAADVKNRINKSKKAMGSLKCAWDTKEVPIDTKIKMCQAITMIIDSWGSESWSRSEGDLEMTEVL